MQDLVVDRAVAVEVDTLPGLGRGEGDEIAVRETLRQAGAGEAEVRDLSERGRRTGDERAEHEGGSDSHDR
jgi:hypothetical protein